MAQRKTLTENQVFVLRWIAEGCTPGVMVGISHRISAAALRSRGLVTTTGRGATWAAAATPAGLAYLSEVDGSDPPIPRRPNTSASDQLIDEIIAAGGTLRVARKGWSREAEIDYEHRARLAKRHSKVPPGKWLSVVVDRAEVELRLVDADDETEAARELVPVRSFDRVGRYHPVARTFREKSERHEISRDQLPRATRIVHAIAVEANRRSWEPAVPADSKNAYGRADWTGTKDGHVTVAAGGRLFHLRLQERGVHTRGPWEAEVARYRNVDRTSTWYRDRELPEGRYDAQGTGTLDVVLSAWDPWLFRGRQSRWGDRQSWTLEQRLPHLFREMEARLIEGRRADEETRAREVKAAEAERRRGEEREQQWHSLMREARRQLEESHRVAHLRRQSEDWHEAERLRRFCEAAKSAHGSNPETEQWIVWGLAYASRLDPLTQPPTSPEAPVETADRLQPYLPQGWSAHGPEPYRS